MRVGKTLADRFDNPPGLLTTKRPAQQSGLEGLALDELHNKVGSPLMLGEVVDRNNIAVLEAGNNLGFSLEAS